MAMAKDYELTREIRRYSINLEHAKVDLMFNRGLLKRVREHQDEYEDPTALAKVLHGAIKGLYTKWGGSLLVDLNYFLRAGIKAKAIPGRGPSGKPAPQEGPE